MVSVLRLRFKREVRCVLSVSTAVRVHQGELDRSTVDTGVLAVSSGKAGNPRNSTKELALNGGGALGRSVGLVEEYGLSRATIVSQLWKMENVSMCQWRARRDQERG